MTIRSRACIVGAVVAMAAAGLSVAATAPPVAAESGDDVVEACQPLTDVPEIGPRFCGGLERGLWFGAQHCRRVEGLEEAVCPSVDGREVHEAAMAEFERGWTARALELQAELDHDVPLTESLILHTHNSANSAAYDPSFTSNDANQVLTITDQLRLGIRGIELDVHWAPHPDGDPAHGFRAPVQCHGQSESGVHVGCSVDQLLSDLLDELDEWLGAHPDEMVLLYLENHLDGDEAAHAAAVEAIEATIGDVVFRPTEGAGCQDLPVHRSKAEILASDARVLITGNCGPGGWTDLVFQRDHRPGGKWNEDGSTTEYLAGSNCDEERAAHDYGTRFIRRYEDSTFLSLMANGGSHISPSVAASLVRCGVNLPGLDQLHPGDERLPAFVWSWRDQEPGDDPARACAAQGADARFGAVPCDQVLPVACRSADGTWAVTAGAVPWHEGDRACVDEGHLAAGVPANGWDNQLLRRSADAADVIDVWLAYGRDDDTDAWARGIPDLPDDESGDLATQSTGHAAGPTDRPVDPAPPGPPDGTPGSSLGPALRSSASSDESMPAALSAVLLAVLAVGLVRSRRSYDAGHASHRRLELRRRLGDGRRDHP